MKHRLILLFLLGALGLKAQTSEINIDQISLIKPNFTSRGVPIGARSAECVKILGKPDSISDYYSEIDEDTMKLYRYGKSELYFLQDKLDEWDILDGSIWVGQVNGRVFKIGDKLTSANGGPSNFRGLPITHSNGKSRNMYFQSANVSAIKRGESYLDCFFELLFDAKGILFSITKYDP